MKNKKYDDDSQSEKIINSTKVLPMYNMKKIDVTPVRKSTFKKLRISKRFSNFVSNEEESEKNEDSIYNSIKRSSISKGYPYSLKQNVFNILSKDFENRTKNEIHVAADYLSKNYIYFINLKKNDSFYTVEKLTKICKLEKFTPGKVIILYGDIGEKFYIVLEGVIEIYKPEFIEQTMTPFQYLTLLNKIKEEDKLKYERIKKKNDNFYFDSNEISKIDPYSTFMRSQFNFFVERDDKKGEYGAGFSFGEIALIKKTTRNATIKSVENSILLSINKNDYNIIMKEIEIKKLGKEVEEFKSNYQFFNCFDLEKMIQIYNCFSKVTLYKGDYLCHQNDINDYIYVITNGKFEVYSYVGFSWLNDYYKYIDDSMGNILFYLINNRDMKYSELLEIVKNIKSDSLNSPMKDLNFIHLDDMNLSNKNIKDDLYQIKNDEEKVNDSKSIFKINLKKIDYQDIIGLEDSFEFKKKFYSVKCLSSSAEVKCLKIDDLLRIIWHFSNERLLYLLKLIINRKNILKNEIINSVKNLEKKILFQFDMRYEKLINYDDNVYPQISKSPNSFNLKTKIHNNIFNSIPNSKKKENEVNRIISAIKFKGYKMSIQDILDEDVSILPRNKTKLEKKIYRTKSAINSNILNSLLRKKSSNSNEFKFKKNISNLSPTNNSKIHFTFLSSNLSNRKTYYSSIKNRKIETFRNFSSFGSDSRLNHSKNKLNLKIKSKNFFSENNSFMLDRNKRKNKTLIKDKNDGNNNNKNILNSNMEDKGLAIKKYLNYKNPSLLINGVSKSTMYLRRNSLNLKSARNNFKMKNKFNINGNVRSIFSSNKKINKIINKMDNIFIRYNMMKNKDNLNANNAQNLKKEKIQNEIKEKENNDRDKVQDKDKNKEISSSNTASKTLDIKDKTYFYSNELKLDFQKRNNLLRKKSILRTLKINKK